MKGLICGPYRVTEKLGEGGIAEVWAAEHHHLGHKVAIKFLLPHVAMQTEFTARFQKEAKALATIDHPGIVKILDIGQVTEDRPYLALEHLTGETLKSLLERSGALPVTRTLRLMQQLASAMRAAHEQHILHRDLKPDNLFVVTDQAVVGHVRLKVLDFGLAKLTSDLTSAGVTTPDMILGTPAYMAPEQCTNSKGVDVRADLYSIGCVFFHCLCGRAPFKVPAQLDEMSAHAAMMHAQLNQPPRAPHRLRAEIPQPVGELVLRLMSKSPAHRLPTCAHLLAELEQLIGPNPPGSASAQAASIRAPSAHSADTHSPPAPHPLPQESRFDALTIIAAEAAESYSDGIPGMVPAGRQVDTRPIGPQNLRAAMPPATGLGPAHIGAPMAVPLPAISDPVARPAMPIPAQSHVPAPLPGVAHHPRPRQQPARHPPYHAPVSWYQRPVARGPTSRRTGVVIAICSVVGLAGATLASEVISEEATITLDAGTDAYLYSGDAGAGSTSSVTASRPSNSGRDSDSSCVDDCDPAAEQSATHQVAAPLAPDKIKGKARDCKKAYQKKRYKVSYHRCGRVLQVAPKHRFAHTYSALSACKLGWRKKARFHYTRADRRERQRIRSTCKQHNMTL